MSEPNARRPPTKRRKARPAASMPRRAARRPPPDPVPDPVRDALAAGHMLDSVIWRDR